MYTTRPNRKYVFYFVLLIVSWVTIFTYADAIPVAPEPLRASVDAAVERVKPALVRINLIAAEYYGGREEKYMASGSGVIIREDGYIVTNHHVAGKSTRIFVTLSTREELEAELVGTDPLSDIAVIRILAEEGRTFPVAQFGDSSQVRVGDSVLAMGSPMSLSQSVTLGIVSNNELIMPRWLGPRRRLEQDGEDVGSLVRWIAHDAQIFSGNSGGPLVNLNGEIIGINEIQVAGLGGAIPGNLAQSVAEQLIAHGKVSRAWLGLMVQPRLKSSDLDRGILISGVIDEGPSHLAGVQAGDVLVQLAEKPISVRFMEEVPLFNQFAADLTIGEPVDAVLLRNDEEIAVSITPIEREEAFPPESEFRQWGITARNISFLIARQMKRDTQEGVLITTIRPGGAAVDAKPALQQNDVIVSVNSRPINSLADLRAITDEVTAGIDEPVPVIVEYDRGTEKYLTVVRVGMRELEDPGLEVRKAWLPVKAQVLTREIAEQLEDMNLSGFRVTQVFENSTAQEAGLQVGDFLLALDGERFMANAPEHYDELEESVRAYRIGDFVELTILRNNERKTIEVELVSSPHLAREMKRYRDSHFDFTGRDLSFFDRAEQRLEQDQMGVLITEVQSGGWADLGQLRPGDLLLEVDNQPVVDVEVLNLIMEDVAATQPGAVVFKIKRGIETQFIELEPRWEPRDET